MIFDLPDEVLEKILNENARGHMACEHLRTVLAFRLASKQAKDVCLRTSLTFHTQKLIDLKQTFPMARMVEDHCADKFHAWLSANATSVGVEEFQRGVTDMQEGVTYIVHHICADPHAHNHVAIVRREEAMLVVVHNTPRPKIYHLSRGQEVFILFWLFAHALMHLFLGADVGPILARVRGREGGAPDEVCVEIERVACHPPSHRQQTTLRRGGQQLA
jgi:hypothetical protein